MDPGTCEVSLRPRPTGWYADDCSEILEGRNRGYRGCPEERRGRRQGPRHRVRGANRGAGGGDDARGREAPPAFRVFARRGERGAGGERGERRWVLELSAGEGRFRVGDQREPRQAQARRSERRRTWAAGARCGRCTSPMKKTRRSVSRVAPSPWSTPGERGWALRH